MRPRDLPRNFALTAHNLLCSLRRKGLDCVVLSIRGSYPELTVRREPLPFPFSRLPLFPQDVSLENVRAAMEMIGNDQRVRDVVLRFDTLRLVPQKACKCLIEQKYEDKQQKADTCRYEH